MIPVSHLNFILAKGGFNGPASSGESRFLRQATLSSAGAGRQDDGWAPLEEDGSPTRAAGSPRASAVSNQWTFPLFIGGSSSRDILEMPL